MLFGRSTSVTDATTTATGARPGKKHRFGRKALIGAATVLTGIGLIAAPASAAPTRQNIVDKATSQLGGRGCDPSYYNSCDIEWCAEFARWVWGTSGVPDVKGLDAWAQSFKTYGQNRGLYHSRSSGYVPQPGDAIVFDWDRSSSDGHPIDHVAIVTSTDSSRVYTIGGNQENSNNRLSKVSRASYQRSSVSIDGYVSPVGVGAGSSTDQPRRGDSVTGDSFADLVVTGSDGTMTMYANNIVRDDGVPYTAGTKIGSSWGSTYDQVVKADVTGDGYTDLVVRKTDGTLWLYPNNIERDNGSPYGAATQIGHGWNGFNKLIGADVTGDGFTDLVARKPDGTLWLYANNFARNNASPFSTAKQIGFSGWNFEDLIGADVTGDGFTDMVARKSDGTLWLYSNNIGRDNGMPYSAAPTQIGHGWNAFTAIVGADVTGDGFTDLVVRKSDSTLWYYANNIERDNGTPYGTATQIGFSGWNSFNRIM